MNREVKFFENAKKNGGVWGGGQLRGGGSG